MLCDRDNIKDELNSHANITGRVEGLLWGGIGAAAIWGAQKCVMVAAQTDLGGKYTALGACLLGSLALRRFGRASKYRKYFNYCNRDPLINESIRRADYRFIAQENSLRERNSRAITAAIVSSAATYFLNLSQ